MDDAKPSYLFCDEALNNAALPHVASCDPEQHSCTHSPTIVSWNSAGESKSSISHHQYFSH